MRKPFILLILAAAWGVPAAAGIFDEDARRELAQYRAEQEKKGADVEARLVKLDESFRNLGILQLLNQIEQLNGEIAKLRGQIEVLANQNDQLTRRQKDFYLDIDTRLRKLEGLPPDPANSPAAAGTPPVGPVGVPAATVATAAPAVPALTPAQQAAKRDKEDAAYDVGSAAFKRNDFAGAIRAFKIYVTDYPQGVLIANAHYWIGISHRNLKDFAAARAAQEALIKSYPDSPKVPDALLEIANVQTETSDLGSAKNTLEDIIARFPSSDAAAKARTRLAALRR